MMCWFRNRGSHVFAFIAKKAFLKRLASSQDQGWMVGLGIPGAVDSCAGSKSASPRCQLESLGQVGFSETSCSETWGILPLQDFLCVFVRCCGGRGCLGNWGRVVLSFQIILETSALQLVPGTLLSCSDVYSLSKYAIRMCAELWTFLGTVLSS